ncbi:threonine aldolase family protein [Reinekea blandensis]|uniref:L-threonine aldolase n=1 Tax=Reinekea blandensis MED297 TaxID=314283 RepID=A4BK51_9GAMM|nr:low specificity L-threonine aldolase [Reinekea blandensis]EAR07480.1 Threonine aldolase [Reinekea sp. MED297] [Reinekea blandensis MED297]
MHFGSDNQAGASEQIFSFLQQANQGIEAAYGDDQWTARAVQAIKDWFEYDAEVFLVSTGTAANSMALACLCDPWDSVLCHGQAHIINDELTAPEFFTGGARLIGLDTQQAKLTLQTVRETLELGAAHPPHNAVPKALSLTQINESGQVYSPEEVKAFSNLAHDHGLHVHMDGARFANALEALGCSPAELTWKAGVDVLCLGATKNGALAAEAVVFFNRTLARHFVQHRKRSGHLLSKGRWMGAQFCGWLADDHWRTLARQANQCAQSLANAIEAHPLTHLVWPVKANELFVRLPKSLIQQLRDDGAVFYEWPRNFVPESLIIEDDEDIVRMVTSFQTRQEDVEQFIALLNQHR